MMKSWSILLTVHQQEPELSDTKSVESRSVQKRQWDESSEGVQNIVIKIQENDAECGVHGLHMMEGIKRFWKDVLSNLS